MNEKEPRLSNADLRVIADIRRELDAEFGPPPDDFTVEPPSPNDPLADEDAEPPKRRRRVTVQRARRGLLVAFMVGALAGAGLDCLAIFVWRTQVREESARVAPPARDAHGTSADDRARAPAAADEVVLLQDALGEWIAATKRGDIPTQMRFYPARVPVYYTWRDVPRDAVRAEKVKVFGAAHILSITTDTPTVEILEDRLTAITRFRKRYVIEGLTVRRRGEVMQELRWMRTAGGWLIVGERDARVLVTG